MSRTRAKQLLRSARQAVKIARGDMLPAKLSRYKVDGGKATLIYSFTKDDIEAIARDLLRVWVLAHTDSDDVAWEDLIALEKRMYLRQARHLAEMGYRKPKVPS